MQSQILMLEQTGQSHCFGFFRHHRQSCAGVGFGRHEQLHLEHTGQRQTIPFLPDLLADGVIGHVESLHFGLGSLHPRATVGSMIAIQIIADKITIIFIVMIYFLVLLSVEMKSIRRFTDNFEHNSSIFSYI